jgi:tRNA nucleotidyltransferase (CCA-adding enzyme)
MIPGVVIEDPRLLLEHAEAMPAVRALLEQLDQHPMELYLVGGAVRDLILGEEPADLDLLSTEEVEPVAHALGRVRAHDRFGTATVYVGGFRYDLARARSESYPEPGSLPQVAPAGLGQDLKRRDFTVNALALGLLGRVRGEVRTVPHAWADLRNRQLRVLHRASFIDDPTRLLRLARYRARLGFKVEPETAALVAEARDTDALATVSGGRIGAELWLLAQEPDPIGGFQAVRELRLADDLAPGLAAADPAVGRAALATLTAERDRAVTALAWALLEVSAPERIRLLERLMLPSGMGEAVLRAAGGTRGLLAALGEAKCPSQLVAAAEGAGPAELALAAGLGGEEAVRAVSELRGVALEIDGHDLTAAGIAVGPAIRAGLEAALAAKLDGAASGREAELEVALAAARQRED